MDERQSVLIVDPSEENCEVLQTALERRGVRIFSANRAKRGLELARRHHPDLIVLDLEVDDVGELEDAGRADDAEKLDAVGELDAAGPENHCNPFSKQSRADHSPLVILGTARRHREGLPDGEFVSKPYHYGPLIRRIEELLRCSGESSPCEGGEG